MATLVSRIAQLLRREQPPRPGTAVGIENVETAWVGPTGLDRASTDRLRQYEEAEALDAGCAEAAAALDTIASLVSASREGEDVPFRIEWEAGAPQAAREALDDLVRRTHLGPKCYPIARDAAKYGDNFLEVVVDDSLAVTRLKHLPARQIFREEGPHGELLDPAFTQRLYAGGAPVVEFHPWQVVHIRWGHLGEKRYGRSHLAVASAVWQRLRPLEESMRTARLERAYDKLVHYVEVPPEVGPEEAQRRMDDYRRRIGSRVVYNAESGTYELHRQAQNVRTDFYVPVSRGENGATSGGDIKLLAAENAQLAQIDDVRYLHRQLLCSLRVPAAFLGFEEDVNARATVAEQFAEFARTIRRAQSLLSSAFRQVFDLQLLLLGFEPGSLAYRVVWPPVRVSA